MSENRDLNRMIESVSRDIENYRQAIENAEGAFVEAERELDELLEQAYGSDLH